MQGWARLFGGVIAIYGALVLFELSTEKIAAVAPVYEFAQQHRLDAGELFYTDSEAAGKVEFHLLKKRQAEARRTED